MIKKITTLLLVALVAPQFVLASGKATVFNPETGERKQITIGEKFDKGYILELNYLDDKKLGFGVVSDYKTTLSSPVSATQSTLPASSVTTTDGHTLTMADFGSKVFLTVEPGGIKQEIAMCTGISGTTWTGCTRGLAFYGSSTASVAANRKTHSAGVQVIISNVHYIYQQLLNKEDDETVAGTKTFTSLPLIPTTTPTIDGHVASKKYVDDTINAGAPDATESVKGISELSQRSEASGGISVGGTGARLILPSSIASSSADVATSSVVVTQNTGRINPNFYQANSNTWTSDNVFTGTTTATNFVHKGFGGDGRDGVLNVTSGTTTLDALGATLLSKQYSSINISAGATLTITNQSASGTILYLKSQGNVTIAGKIELTGKGATTSVSGLNSQDSIDHDATNAVDSTGGANTDYQVGVAGQVYTNLFLYPKAYSVDGKRFNIAVGSGGSSGGMGWCGSDGKVVARGIGGNGGGSLILESGGYLNFTGTINANGGNGTNGANAVGSCGAGQRGSGGGGGGGGAAGMVYLFYNKLISSAGTINTKGGAGGNGGDNQPFVSGAGQYGGASGAGGGAYSYAGKTGVAPPSSSNGTNGTASALSEGASGGSGAYGESVSRTGGIGGTAGANDTNHYLIAENLYW